MWLYFDVVWTRVWRFCNELGIFIRAWEMVVKRNDALRFLFILLILSENLMLFRELQMNWSFGCRLLIWYMACVQFWSGFLSSAAWWGIDLLISEVVVLIYRAWIRFHQTVRTRDASFVSWRKGIQASAEQVYWNSLENFRVKMMMVRFSLSVAFGTLLWHTQMTRSS